MRIFAAMPLPSDTLEAVSAWMEVERLRFPGLRWVRPGQVHLTLRFLGDVPASIVSELEKTVEGMDIPPVGFTLDSTGCFRAGGAGLPSVYWIGGHFGPEAARMAAELGRIRDDRGRQEKPGRFTPHLTVARQGRFDGEARLSRPGPWSGELRRLVVYNSTLSSSGSSYEELYSRGR
ncbi:RNA 2',3'-cyclic phosphodiesterase [Candidatus Fermentibacteria bacterium]|nr:RNA 2',3'-cyclic phosphodiesterase [Candidatus Fermentibacteria bacterium]